VEARLRNVVFGNRWRRGGRGDQKGERVGDGRHGQGRRRLVCGWRVRASRATMSFLVFRITAAMDFELGYGGQKLGGMSIVVIEAYQNEHRHDEAKWKQDSEAPRGSDKGDRHRTVKAGRYQLSYGRVK